MTNLLILLGLPEPIRNRYRDELARRFPQLHIDVVDHRSKVGPYVANADALITFTPMLHDDVVRDATGLKWIQTLGTGTDNLIDLPSLRDGVVVTNMHGIHGAPVSEAAMSAMLALSRDIPRFVRMQDEHKWTRWPARLLGGKTVGILGVGVISEALAPKCKAFNMRVIGISSSPRPLPGFDEMAHRDRLAEIVPQLDYFVLMTPLSPETRNIIDANILSLMKPDSYLVNLARGGVVDEDALLNVLRNNRIAGAALDVFNTEPLPPDHPFWTLKNALITTHQGGFCDVYPDLVMPTLETNMRCFLAGDTANMINVVKR
jgi:phosphoglycerate dehydrogenase-like enzyme